ncbi:MAG: hypothetical protein GY716_06060 [bacterium]|nr:hypothetical protein [bacterium]
MTRNLKDDDLKKVSGAGEPDLGRIDDGKSITDVKPPVGRPEEVEKDAPGSDTNDFGRG